MVDTGLVGGSLSRGRGGEDARGVIRVGWQREGTGTGPRVARGPTPGSVQTPQRSAGVFTGASHRDSMSASALHTVRETPAMSRLVT